MESYTSPTKTHTQTPSMSQEFFAQARRDDEQIDAALQRVGDGVLRIWMGFGCGGLIGFVVKYVGSGLQIGVGGECLQTRTRDMIWPGPPL